MGRYCPTGEISQKWKKETLLTRMEIHKLLFQTYSSQKSLRVKNTVDISNYRFLSKASKTGLKKVWKPQIKMMCEQSDAKFE